MIESLLGGIFGGLLRLAPEVFKLFDAKDARKHELAMMNAEIELAKSKAESELRQTNAQMTVTELTAMTEAFKEQAATASSSYKWVAAISALVRPSITYWLVAIYSAVKFAAFESAIAQGGEWKAVLLGLWGADDMALLNLVITFWFVGRVFERTK